MPTTFPILGGTGGATAGDKYGIEPLLGAYLPEAQRLEGIENGRRDETLGFLRQEFQRGTPMMGDDVINRMFGASANRINADTQAMARRVRQSMGSSGVYGGVPAGIMAQAQLGRMGQLAEQRTNLKTFQTQFNAGQAAQRMRNAFGIGEVMNQAPPMVAHDALGDMIGTRLTQQGLAVQDKASKRASKDARLGGILGAVGGILGGI